MNRDLIRQKLQTDQAWLERAIVSLTNNQAWDADHVQRATYFFNWINRGNHLSGRYVEEARQYVMMYVDDLLNIILRTKREHVAKLKAEIEREERAIKQIEEALSTLPLTGESNIPFEKPVKAQAAPLAGPPKQKKFAAPAVGGGAQVIQKQLTAGDAMMPDGSGRTVAQACFEEGFY